MTFGHSCQKESAVCGKGGGGGVMKIFIWICFLNIDMPLTNTETLLPMLITKNIKLSKLKIISSPSTRYYTILQTQTRGKKSGSRKCTTALVLYKITSKNDEQWSTKFGFSYHRHSAAGFRLFPFTFSVRSQQHDRQHGLGKTARSVVTCASRDGTASLACALLLCGTLPVEITAGPK